MAAKRDEGDYSPAKITAELIRQVAAWPAPEKPKEVRDSHSGLVLRHQPTGFLGLYALLGRGKRERICNARDIVDTSRDFTMAKARKQAQKLRGDDAGGRDFKVERERQRGVPTLRDWLKAELEGSYGWWVVRNRKTGEATLARLVNLYDKKFGAKKLDELTPSGLEAWRTTRLTQAARETVNRDVGALKAALQKAVEWEILDSHPLKAVRPLKVDRHRRSIRALSDGEVVALLEGLEAREAQLRAARDSGNAWRAERGYELLPALAGDYVDALRPAVELSLETGIRKGECFALRWEWIDLKGAAIRLPGEATKSFTTRDVPLTDRAVSLLRRWSLQNGRPAEGYVFGHPDGTAVQSLKKSYRAVLVGAGIKPTAEGRVTWHSLRHTFGTRLGAAGVDADTLRRLMGHASLQTTQRYLHGDRDRMKAAVALLGAGK